MWLHAQPVVTFPALYSPFTHAGNRQKSPPLSGSGQIQPAGDSRTHARRESHGGIGLLHLDRLRHSPQILCGLCNSIPDGDGMFLFLKPVRLCLRALSGQSAPRQLSMGLALGILVGLVPKGNLLAVLLGLVLAASRVNLAVAAAAIVCCSLASPLLDPVSHLVGSWLLHQPGLSAAWTWLYNQPVVRWTAFNNSVVLGSFVTGLLLLYPAHRMSHPLFEKYSAVAGMWVRRFWLTRALMGAEWAARAGAVE